MRFPIQCPHILSQILHILWALQRYENVDCICRGLSRRFTPPLPSKDWLAAALLTKCNGLDATIALYRMLSRRGTVNVSFALASRTRRGRVVMFGRWRWLSFRLMRSKQYVWTIGSVSVFNGRQKYKCHCEINHAIERRIQTAFMLPLFRYVDTCDIYCTVSFDLKYNEFAMITDACLQGDMSI